MAARAAAIALCLAALASAGTRPGRRRSILRPIPGADGLQRLSCQTRTQGQGLGAHPGETQPERAGQDRTYEGEAPPAGFRHWPHAQRIHGRVHMEFRVH